MKFFFAETLKLSIHIQPRAFSGYEGCVKWYIRSEIFLTPPLHAVRERRHFFTLFAPTSYKITLAESSVYIKYPTKHFSNCVLGFGEKITCVWTPKQKLPVCGLQNKNYLCVDSKTKISVSKCRQRSRIKIFVTFFQIKITNFTIVYDIQWIML